MMCMQDLYISPITDSETIVADTMIRQGSNQKCLATVLVGYLNKQVREVRWLGEHGHMISSLQAPHLGAGTPRGHAPLELRRPGRVVLGDDAHPPHSAVPIRRHDGPLQHLVVLEPL